MRIDVHAHYHPESCMDLMNEAARAANVDNVGHVQMNLRGAQQSSYQATC